MDAETWRLHSRHLGRISAMKKKLTNEAQELITMREHYDFHAKVDAFFRRRGLIQTDYRQKNTKIINEMKRRKALEIKEIC